MKAEVSKTLLTENVIQITVSGHSKGTSLWYTGAVVAATLFFSVPRLSPMMLREMQAFQACWMDLKDDYPTSREDNTLIAQAMGQLVDRYQKPNEVEESLPDYLQPLFRRLALAYFQGYETQAPLEGEPSLPGPQSLPPCAQQQAIAATANQVQWLAQRARHNQKTTRQAEGIPLSEMDTLIIEIPEHWRTENES
jgi:hypothetical protein